MKINLNVRGVVEHRYRTGDLTSELMETSRMLDGTKTHQAIQSTYAADDEKEVFLAYEFSYKGYEFRLQGRMDGLLENGTLIDEIKSTVTDPDDFDFETRPEYTAQLFVYAFMYLQTVKQKQVYTQLSFVRVEDLKTKRLKKRMSQKALTDFFEETIYPYLDWYITVVQSKEHYLSQTELLSFPFTFREKQKELTGAVYKTMQEHDLLYAIAPTGSGKTISTLYGTMKTATYTDKIFYLTAKNSHKELALDTVELLNQQNLGCRAVEITAKATTCFLEEKDCDPDVCPYAKDYFRKVNAALADIYNHGFIYDRKLIESKAEEHQVCPFEFQLMLAQLSEVIICDYNYAFDPLIQLIRFFQTNETSNKLLIDEAHNLVTRSLDMYSAILHVDTLNAIHKIVKSKKLKRKVKQLKNTLTLDSYISELQDYEVMKQFDALFIELSLFMQEHKKEPVHKLLLPHLFDLISFKKINDYYNMNYKWVHTKDVSVEMRCMDAAEFIKDVVDHNAGTVFFSATMTPLNYYQQLLTEGTGYYLDIPSPFKAEHFGLFYHSDISMKYQNRSDSFLDVVASIKDLQDASKNTAIFAPSYTYLEELAKEFPSALLQTREQTQKDRNDILKTLEEEVGHLALFVLGGTFSEGVDYKGNMLEQVLILGVGLPSFNEDNELKKHFFEDKFKHGFEYAYMYPGMNKIIQAVGRLIRTFEDKGVCVLIDDRYASRRYQELFLPHWSHAKRVTRGTLKQEIDLFWRTYEHNN